MKGNQMKTGQKRIVRAFVIIAVTAAFLIPDVITKRWAEDNLANWGHMLAVKPAAGAATVGDAVRQRFPEMKDAGLQGILFKLPDKVAIEPTDKVHELDNKSGFAVEGFLAFDPDGRFARRVQRLDSQIVKRLVSRAAPESDPATVAKQVQQELSSVTVRDFILERIPAESKRTVDRTIREGLFVVPRTGLVQVEPDSPVEPGATYLLAERTVTVVEGFWEYSYAENPAGAFSMLLWLDAKLRLAIFLTFGIVAILALGYMIVRPPSESWLLTVALGAVLGGAIGNYGDRVTLTYVVDFIHMYWRDYHWPKYNIADIGITGGVIVLLAFSIFWPNGSKKSRSA